MFVYPFSKLRSLGTSRRVAIPIVLLTAFAWPAAAQLKIGEHEVQVHGFVNQGFAYSDVNNFLTMDTSKGSFAFTDAGLNVSTPITDRFRVGAQAYVRNVGQLGRGHVSIDWALGDYRIFNWLGIRAGKVKTPFGLYNDTQDVEFLHTFALLPQSIYPIDLRANSIAHLGADIYGQVSVPKVGRLSYAAYGGQLSLDRAGGYAYGLNAFGVNPSRISGRAAGAHLKWETPIPGLIVGASYLDSPKKAVGINGFRSSFKVDDFSDKRSIFYGQYSVGNLRVEGEYSRQIMDLDSYNLFGYFGPPLTVIQFDRRAWYVAGAYRFSKHLELGAYNSRFLPNDNAATEGNMPIPSPARHLFDKTIAARIDLTKYWDVKIEGHFIDGYGDPSSFVGFYPQDNLSGMKPNTNVLILRTGFVF